MSADPRRPSLDEQLELISTWLVMRAGLRQPAIDKGLTTAAEADSQHATILAIKATLELQADVIKALKGASHALKSYSLGNAAPHLAAAVAAFVDEVLDKLEPGP